jgi:transaldolase
LTISPELLGNLNEAQADLCAFLTPEGARASQPHAVPCDEQSFRFLLNEDAMASEKLSEGIRAFVADARKLDVLIDAQR